MGCEQSLPVERQGSAIGKTERQPRSGLHAPEENTENSTASDARVVVKRPTEVTTHVVMDGSNASRGGGTGSTVSLEVDEFIGDELPKLDHKGHLMPEEVVRRTSSCICVSNILVGNKAKCGKEMRVTYAYRSQRGYYPDGKLFIAILCISIDGGLAGSNFVVFHRDTFRAQKVQPRQVWHHI